MNDSALKDDLAYVRDLAEAGQTAPLLGGRFLAWWGGLVTLAYASHFMIAEGMFGLGSTAYGILWAAFGIIGLGGYFLLVKSMSGNKPGASSAANRTEANVWLAGGFALFAYFITLTIKSILTQTADPGFMSSLPLVFSVYGTGLLTSGLMAKNNHLRNAGFMALTFVAISTWFSGTTFIWAIASLGAFITVFLPGIALLRQEPKSVV